MVRDWCNNKVAVFISSKCDNAGDIAKGRLKYGVVRKALKLLLEETGVCEVYAFEEASGSSCNVVHSYMDKLDDSDLVIVIVDNKDGITDATMKEINRVRAIEKKCIYIFCDEQEKNITELQRELQATSGSRFAVAHEFSDITKFAYEAVINDVLDLYKSYCKGRVDYTKTIAEEDKGIEMSLLPLASDSEISKTFIEGFAYTKYVVKAEANVVFGKVEKPDDIDKDCADLIGTIIGSNLTDVPDFSKIRNSVKKLHKGNIQRLVQLRYDAVEQYFLGNIEQCVDKLKECLAFCDSCKNLPKWVSNDVALDLRNMQMEVGREKNIINFYPQGQERLEEDKEPLYYPVLDRLVSDFNEDLLSHQFNLHMQSPYTVNFGGVGYTVEKACKSFLIAFYYGSITQMLMIRKRLYNCLMSMSMERRDHKIFMFCIRLLLLTNDEKMLKKYLDVYGENTNSINSQDVELLYRGIMKQPSSSRQLLARIYLFKYFGYYYADAKYSTEAANLVFETKKRIEAKATTAFFVKPMIEAISENDRRMAGSLIAEYLLYIFQQKCKRYYDDVFEFLYNYSFETADINEFKNYQELIVGCLSNEEILGKCHNLVFAAQTLRQNETISHIDLDDAVCKYAPKFYEETYLLNTRKHGSGDSWDYTKWFLDVIDKDNETQGKNGAYMGNGYNPYITIANIMINDNVKNDSRQIKQILDSIQGTLLVQSQTFEAKVSALMLLCIVQLTHPQNRQVKPVVQKLKAQWKKVINAKDLFLVKGYGRENLELNFLFLRQLIEKVDNHEVLRVFISLQNSEIPNKMTALSTVERFLDVSSAGLAPEHAASFMQFVMNESYSTNYDLRFRAMSVMVKMLRTDFNDICLKRFVEMIDNEPYKNKVGMLYRLKEYNNDNPRVKYIFEKGKTDSHYWVRKVASSN